MMKKPFAHGSIFAVPLPDGTYIFGRVMMDINEVLRRRLFPHDSTLTFFTGACLMEMYFLVAAKPVYVSSPVLIPGALVESKELGGKWPIVGHEPVDPRRVEFPEYLICYRHPGGDAAFHCGEIGYPLPFSENDVIKVIGVLGGRQTSFYWPHMCLWALGRRSEIPPEWTGISLVHNDLRYSAHRAKVYEHLPFKMEQTYFEKQASLGLDIARLYE